MEPSPGNPPQRTIIGVVGGNLSRFRAGICLLTGTGARYEVDCMGLAQKLTQSEIEIPGS